MAINAKFKKEEVCVSELKEMPKEEGLEKGLSMLREGYMYISNRAQSFQSEVFETRLLGEKAICMIGEDAAKLFYDNNKFIRKGAAPKRAQKTLLGEGGVQTLDGQEHRHRKAMFMQLMKPASLERMKRLIKDEWQIAIDTWEQKDQIVLYEETKQLLMRAVCKWSGVPLEEDEVKKRADDMAAMFETPVTIGLEQHRGRKARRESEAWIEELVEKVREERIKPDQESVLYQFSWHRDLEGELLDKNIVAVEILNILRPTIAVTIYINFIALSLHQHPEEKGKLASRDEQALMRFVQEVRRFYPFFPLNGARVKQDFVWKGYTFKEGTLTLLDFYGTNHDPNIWENPNLFNPDRFTNWEENPFTLIPQGGGDHHTGHRCAGEWITLDIMKISLDCLANDMTYDVPKQDFSYSLVDMPSIPKSRFIMENIKRK